MDVSDIVNSSLFGEDEECVIMDLTDGIIKDSKDCERNDENGLHNIEGLSFFESYLLKFQPKIEFLKNNIRTKSLFWKNTLGKIR